MATTSEYHSHIYFDENTREIAEELCHRIQEKFDVQIGRFWDKNVGPHPRWSVQIKYEPNKFGRVMPYLMKNRRGLTVFTHPVTGDDFKDHTEHAIWMGELLDLNLDALKTNG